MAKERVLSFIEARSNLSKIVDQVSERGQTYVVAKRAKPVAVILGIQRYREMASASRNLKSVRDKRILKLRGMGTATGDIDRAIKDLRKSRVAPPAGAV